MTRRTSATSMAAAGRQLAAETNKSNANVNDAERLGALLDDVGRLIEQTDRADNGLHEKCLSLQMELKKRVEDAFTSPVADWDDFRVKLRQVELEYRRDHFGDALTKAAVNLNEFLHANEERKGAAEYWKAHTLLYELNDILRFDESGGINKLAEKVGRRLLYELREKSEEWGAGEEVDLEERRLLQEKVLYCACRANELKRAGDIEAAKDLFKWLLDFTSTKLQITGVLPCLGIQASLRYNLGSVYRKLELHDDAEEMYSSAIEYMRLRASARGERDPGEKAFSVRQQAMAVGIGLGWVNLTRGFLKRAENALTTARSLLANSHDPLVPAYIELLYGTIRRCRAGTDMTKLKGAIDSLRSARQQFEKNNHERYVPRACWELALALNLARRFDEVEEPLRVVARYAETMQHPKWRTNVKILESRVLLKRGDVEGGLRKADEAVSEAIPCKSVLPLVDAHIIRGEAELEVARQSASQPGDYSKARAEFEEAQRLLLRVKVAEAGSSWPSNPKIIAVCQLRIAECYAREGDEMRAKEHFAEWKILRASVEHEWVRELAALVEKEISKLSMNFVISARDAREWSYAENVARLRVWLLTQALRHTKMNYSKAADLIGVKRGTLYQWQESSRSQSKRARISGEEKLSAGGRKN